MSERMDRMPRGQWMTTDGRELYHEWLTGVLERDQTDETDYSYIFKLNDTGISAWIMQNNLFNFSKAFSEQLISKNDSLQNENMRLLRDSLHDIKHYTSADEVNSEFPNWPVAITRHTQDGIDFACRVSTGLAYDAYEAAGYQRENTAEAYETLAGIMRDPSFHEVLEQFSITGFGVLRNQTRNAMLQDDMPLAVSKIIGMSDAVDRIVLASRDTEGEVSYSLNPAVAKHLIERLREQNVDRFLPRTESMAMRDRIKEHSFTTGCPVRKPPQSAVLKGEQKSGIALLSEYMGGELVRAIGSHTRQTELAGTALRSLQVAH